MTTHLYIDDGTRDIEDRGRCRHCGLPKRNRKHDLPDVPAQAEHRRRAGEEDE